jgi:protein TonB
MNWPRRSIVPCIEHRLATIGCVALLTACGNPAPPRPPAVTAAVAPAPAKPVPAAPAQANAKVVLPPATRARTWDEFKRQAAQRMVAANPDRCFDGPVPEPLLAIPVLEIELEADGRVRNVRVMRQPSQARDTTQLAIDAVHRAAPFGPVAHLPRPWKFAEVFLFDDSRRFKPRTLDE